MSKLRRTFIPATLLALVAAAIILATAPEAAAQAPAAEAAAGPVGQASRPSIPLIWWIAPIGSALALIFAVVFYKSMMAADEGDREMIEIAAHVREGAMAYLKQQYKVVTLVFVVLSLILAFMAFGLHVQHRLVPFAFLTGGFFSGLCGFLGMRTATNAAHRTTAGARQSLNRGLVVAFRSGAVMGLVVVGFGLIDISGWFLLLYSGVLPFEWAKNMTLNEITVVMLTFGMGASTQALFARVGGGIYTKAADVGADLVGKVEAGIPEDDPRNPATIADNVGDNVGDVAGMGADLYESYCGSILATSALGVAAATALLGAHSPDLMAKAIRLIAAPMALAGVGIILSIVGIYLVRTREGATMGQLMGALSRGVNGSSLLIAVAAVLICRLLLADVHPDLRWWGVCISILAGLVAGIIIGKATEYYTSYEYKPTLAISEQAITGPATVIIAGVAEGMKSTWAALTTVIVAILFAFIAAGGTHEFMLGLYGVGFAAVGMLSTLGITLATDAYGPIADNAGGNAQMTNQKPEVRERTDALDSLGNTTAATGKGFAIGSAALTALALLAAYVEEVRIGQIREAESFIEARVDGAGRQAEAAVGDIYYVGHGKFGTKYKPGTGEGDYDAFMVLSGKLHGFKAGDRLTGVLSPPDVDDHTRRIDLGEHELTLVSVRKASLMQYMNFYNANLMNPQVLCGLFSGVLLAFLFCSLTMKAVGRAANRMMLECRQQFAKMRAYLKSQGHDDAFVANPDNWPMTRITYEGSTVPDYAKSVAISTRGAQREMILPSLLAIILPVVIGVLFGVPGVMGLLAGGLTSGFAVAIFMANAGGAWDNAKKWIETGRHGGKGSAAHKASVVGDTVGDPFKDTSGPSLNILIKLMSMVSIVFAGLVVKYSPYVADWMGLGR